MARPRPKATSKRPRPRTKNRAGTPEDKAEAIRVLRTFARLAAFHHDLYDVALVHREAAVREAVGVGLVYRAIAPHADLSHSRVGQIVRHEPTGPGARSTLSGGKRR